MRFGATGPQPAFTGTGWRASARTPVAKLLKRFVPVSDYNWLILLQDFFLSKTLNSVSCDGVDERSYRAGNLVIAPGGGASWLGRAAGRLLDKLGLSLRLNLRGCRRNRHILA